MPTRTRTSATGTTGVTPRPFARRLEHSRFLGYCRQCRATIPAGSEVMWNPETRDIFHVACWNTRDDVVGNDALDATPSAPTRLTPRTQRQPGMVTPTVETFDDEEVTTVTARPEDAFPVRFHLVGHSMRTCPKVGDTIEQGVQAIVVRALRPEYYAHGSDVYGLQGRGWVFHIGGEVV